MPVGGRERIVDLFFSSLRIWCIRVVVYQQVKFLEVQNKDIACTEDPRHHLYWY